MSTKTLPLDDPRFVNFMAGCPFRWQGDHGALQWLESLYDLGAAGGFPPLPVPVLSVLNPDTGPAGADITVSITGTDFVEGASVNIGTAHSLVPKILSPTELEVVFGAVNIAEPGTLPVSVTNVDGQVSNAIDFTVLEPISKAEEEVKPPALVAVEDKHEQSRDEHGRFN